MSTRTASTKHDFVSDLADLIRPLTQFEGVETWSSTTIRIDEPNSSALYRFNADDGFIYCGEPFGDIDDRQTDAWFDEQHAIGQATHAAGRGDEWCLNSAQEGGWEAARDAAHEDDGVWDDDDDDDDWGGEDIVDQRHYQTGCGAEGEPMWMPDR